MKVHNFKQYWLLCFETFFTGSQIGTVVGLQVSGVLCWSLGWQSVFYVFGINIYSFCCLRHTENILLFVTIARRDAHTRIQVM